MATRRSYPAKSTPNSKTSKSSNAIMPFSAMNAGRSFVGFILRVIRSISDELWAIFLAIGAIIVFLALVSNTIGVAGALGRKGLGDIFGIGRFMLVGIFIFIAIRLFIKGINEANSQKQPEIKSVSIRTSLFGSFVALIIFSAMADIASGPFSMHAKMSKLYSSGGLLGSIVGTSLSSIFGSIGTFLILLAALLAVTVVVFSIKFSNLIHLATFARSYIQQRRERRNELELQAQQRMKASIDDNEDEDASGELRNQKTKLKKSKFLSGDGDAHGDPEFENSDNGIDPDGIDDSTDAVHRPTKISDLENSHLVDDTADTSVKTQLSLPLVDESITKWLKPPAKLLVNSINQIMDQNLVEDAGNVLVNASADFQLLGSGSIARAVGIGEGNSRGSGILEKTEFSCFFGRVTRSDFRQ